MLLSGEIPPNLVTLVGNLITDHTTNETYLPTDHSGKLCTLLELEIITITTLMRLALYLGYWYLSH